MRAAQGKTKVFIINVGNLKEEDRKDSKESGHSRGTNWNYKEKGKGE